MLTEGLGLMVAGMGVVFAFLTLLVLSMNASAKFFEIFADYFVEVVPVVKSKAAVVRQSDDELAAVAVAIAAAKACAGS
ncbi:MAG: OadG family protein [Proteobacteria bacterium]|nr:OadG family protein [Pseudomonadota bacterium]